MSIKSCTLITVSFFSIFACDLGPEADAFDEEDLEARAALVSDAIAPQRMSNYCEVSEVLRAQAVASREESDGDIARDRERALLDGLRAGQPVFGEAEQLVVRGAGEVHVRVEGDWLIASAPDKSTPLARVRHASGARAHVLALGVDRLVIEQSVGRADLDHLIVMTGSERQVDVLVEQAPACLVIDGGGDAVSGGLNLEMDTLAIPVPETKSIVIHGTGSADYLVGGSGIDLIYCYAGNDVARGLGETDAIYGNEGDDDIDGGGGWNYYHADFMYAGKGNDLMRTVGLGGECAGQDGYDTCFCIYSSTCEMW